MKVRNTTFRGRKGWEVDNDGLSLVMLAGGGHIASITLHEGARVNPLWVPVWKTIEPWKYTEAQARRYGSRLLASICGHNLCLGWFGDPSDEEAKAGMGCHGEAPVVRWKAVRKRVTASGVALTCGCELPVAQLSFTRTLVTRRGSNVVEVGEQVRNRARRDVPFTMCEHVTVGPPFLEKGVTVFDMPATRCHTFPGEFEKAQRLKSDTAFTWPHGPGKRGGKVDLRTIGRGDRVSADFSTQLMDPSREDAWFGAVNPRLGLALAYVWRRRDFPWLGNWEEDRGRKEKPWAGKSLTRGMEFSNTPFPVGLREAVTRGTFQRQPTYRWLPARSRVDVRYTIILRQVPPECRGLKDIRRDGRRYRLDLIV
jgi:hypothetical protein